ncbi:death-associated protein kinase 1 [Microcaecilia unicolor]|uniref:Death-associated protein kinase 1-like n=1 Tax=Microcaecilia unicolor TaxID=1415580 RepID=A0A6P7Z672_9AMPH|nr:death-associated protein kinase 1-like [Microcaecilia unicolor]
MTLKVIKTGNICVSFTTQRVALRTEMDFIHAVEIGNVQLVKLFTKQEIDVNYQDQNTNTALHYAAFTGNLEIVRLLLNAGANVLSKNKSGLTPLHLAAFGGSRLVLQQLLNGREDSIDLKSNEGSSVLHEAVRGRHIETVKHLLQKKANCNLQDKDGNTPLHMAVSQESLQICQYLLDCSPNLLLRNKDGKTCLHLAASVGSLAICQLLYVKDPSLANAKDESGESFLFHAVRGAVQSTKSHAELVTWILTICEHILYKNMAGQMVLDVAKSIAAPEAIVRLLNKKTQEQQNLDLMISCQQLANGQVKLFICGHCGVGKTTLANALHQEETFQWMRWFPFFCGSPEAPPSTKGVDITYKDLAGGPFVIWDFAGQMEYYFTHSLLLATNSSNVIYCLVFSLENIDCHRDGGQLESLHQVHYWMRFLNVSIRSQTSGKPRIFLVGSHYDKMNEGSGSEIALGFFELLKGEAKELMNCFEVDYFYMNLKDSNQLKPLCQKLNEKAKEIWQSSQKPGVPEDHRRVMEEIRQLKINKVKFILWKEFERIITHNLVDPIEEEQLRRVVKYLHTRSELLYFSNVCSSQNGKEDLLVLDLQWLCKDIFGTFGKVVICGSSQKEQWSRQELANCLQLGSSEDIKAVLELLEVLELIICPVGKEEYIVPALLTREKGEDIWVKYKHSVYHGVAYYWNKDYGLFSLAFFARLQLWLLKKFTSPGGERFCIWKDGIKCVDGAEVLVQVSVDRRVVNVIGRYDRQSHNSLDVEAARSCWQLLEIVSVHVEELLAETCAVSDWCKRYLSPGDMCQKQDSSSSKIATYTYRDILEAEQQRRTLYQKMSACDDQPWDVLMAGYDLAILASLRGAARVQWMEARTLQHLCRLLDPPHPLGKDWKCLMEKLGNATSQTIQTLEDCAGREKCSPTFRIFQENPLTIDRLCYVLREMEREDCLMEIDNMFDSLNDV